jgi:hypothetical protein
VLARSSLAIASPRTDFGPPGLVRARDFQNPAMSITEPSEQEHRRQQQRRRPASIDHDVDPENAFGEYIESNPCICSRCFCEQFAVSLVAVPLRVVEDRDALNWEIVTDADVGDSWVERETRDPTDEVEVVYPPRVDPRGETDMPKSARRANPPAQIVCKGCGAVDDDGSRSTLSKEAAIEHAARIADRLGQLDIGHDRALLLDRIDLWKSDPELSGKDDLLFEHAVRVAIEQYRSGEFTTLGVALEEQDD